MQSVDRSLSKNSSSSKIGQPILEGLITYSLQDIQLIKRCRTPPHLPLNDNPASGEPLGGPPHPHRPIASLANLTDLCLCF